MSTKNYAIEKFFGPPKQMALGVRKWPFLAKNIKFWPKMAIFSGAKIFKNHLFLFFLHFRPLLIVFNENKKKLAFFWPLFGPIWPVAHSVHRAVPGLASKLRYVLDEKVKLFSILARPKMLPVHSSSTLHTSFSFCRILI